MRRIGTLWLAASAAMLAACGADGQREEGRDTHQRIEQKARTELPAAPPAPDATPSPAGTMAVDAAPVDAARYLGRWTGVEGTYLVVTDPPVGDLELEMQYDLDNKGTFPGTVTPEGIRFERSGRTELLRPGDGDATGLKWLAGKRDCLTVRTGEGYCRD